MDSRRYVRGSVLAMRYRRAAGLQATALFLRELPSKLRLLDDATKDELTT